MVVISFVWLLPRAGVDLWKVVYRWATLLSFKSSGDYVVIRVVLPSKKISSFFKCLEKYSFRKHWYEVSFFLLQFSFYFSKMSCESAHIESRVHVEFHSTCILEEVRLIYFTRANARVYFHCNASVRPVHIISRSFFFFSAFAYSPHCKRCNLQIGRIWKHRLGGLGCMDGPKRWRQNKMAVLSPCWRALKWRLFPILFEPSVEESSLVWSFPDYCGRYKHWNDIQMIVHFWPVFKFVQLVDGACTLCAVSTLCGPLHVRQKL